MKMNFYGRELPVFRANLHTHSKVSDGGYTPQEVIDLYAAEGYDVLAMTDHHKMNPVSTYDPKGMTLISGVELHPMGPRNIIWHLLCLNLPEDFPSERHPMGKGSGQATVDDVLNAGGTVFCAHPFWCGLSSRDILDNLNGIAGIEIYNSSCVGIGKACNDQCWDELIAAGFVKGAIAVDDTHTAFHAFGGWTMIAAPDKSVKSIMNALNSGHFYASQGPVFHRLELNGHTFEADFSEAEEAVLMAKECIGFSILVPPPSGRGERKTVSSGKVELPENFHGAVRLRIRDANHRYAWSAPVMVP